MPSSPSHRVLSLVLALLLSRGGAAAQVPPTSPVAIGTIPAAQIPDGTTSTLGVRAGVNLLKMRGDTWALRDDQVRTDFLIAVSAGDRFALDVAVPLLVQADASHVALGPIFLGGGIVLQPRPTGARGVAVALRIASNLPLDDASTARFDTEFGVAADVMLAHDIHLGAYAGLGASARYGLRDPAFQSFDTGAGGDVPLGAHLHLLAGLSGRVDVWGGPSVRAEAWAGLRGRVGHVFITGTAGTPLTGPGLLLDLIVHAGTGDGLVPPAEREDAEPPEHGCVLASCTPQQKRAVARAYAAHLEVLRKHHLALAALIELRFHVHAPASVEREIVRITIPNDLSIPNDGDRKRELSIRFLVAAFARGAIPITREIAAALLDRTAFHVQVERDIDESVVDYFTYDMRTLAAAYAGYLQDNAARLAAIAKELRVAWVGTDEMLLDIGRGHVNGVIGVLNGVLDLPLAPINLGLFLAGESTIHGLGRIPHLEYESDWGRKNGGAMEVGVAIGTMTGPASAIFAGLGNTVAPALMRLGEGLSLLTWRGLPVGKIIANVLATWMKGSVVAVKMHAATDAAEIVRAFITHKIRQPDGTWREMTAEDFEQLVYALIQDAAVAKAVLEAERGIAEEPPAKREQEREGGKGIRPPKPRLPKDGTWSGEPGNSFFKPNHPEKLGLRPDEVIEFVEGRPNFSPWAVEEFEVPGMNGDHKYDRSLIKRTIARRKGLLKRDGTPNESAAQDWLDERELAAHHAKGYLVQLIPGRLHEVVRHTGGAYDLRQRGK